MIKNLMLVKWLSIELVMQTFACANSISSSPYYKMEKVEEEKRVTVIGIAENAKGQAYVATQGGNYFLHNIYSWNDDVIGQKVKVTGKLVIITNKKESTSERLVGEWVGTRRYLKRAEWTVIK